MEIFKAIVINNNEKYYINIEDQDETAIASIPISDDEPNKVKFAFNSLILRLKQGLFSIKMPEVEGNLYAQVANEYIIQLNKELKEVFEEMEHHNLIEN